MVSTEEELVTCYDFPSILAPAFQCWDFIVGHTGDPGIVIDKSAHALGRLHKEGGLFGLRVFIQSRQVPCTGLALFVSLDVPAASVVCRIMRTFEMADC